MHGDALPAVEDGHARGCRANAGTGPGDQGIEFRQFHDAPLTRVFQQHTDALPAPGTGRGNAELLAAFFQLAGHGVGQANAGYTQRMTDGDGTSFVLGGLNMPTRDYARFGQLLANGGVWNGTQIVPAEWIQASTAATAPTAPGEIGYGFQWWVPVGATPGEFMARGVYGQYIYIDTARNVVIATNAADRKFREDGVPELNIAIFRALATALD